MIAYYNSDKKIPLVMEGRYNRVVALNFYPPSNRCRGDFWDIQSDGGLLLVNAIKYVGSYSRKPKIISTTESSEDLLSLMNE